MHCSVKALGWFGTLASLQGSGKGRGGEALSSFTWLLLEFFCPALCQDKPAVRVLRFPSETAKLSIAEWLRQPCLRRAGAFARSCAASWQPLPHSCLRKGSCTSLALCVLTKGTSAEAVEPLVSLARCAALQAVFVAQADIYFVSPGEKGRRTPDGFLQARSDPYSAYGDRCL